MQSFQQFLLALEDDMSHINPIDREEVKELFRIAFERYKKEITDFLKDLAETNSDDQLSELVKRLDGSGHDMPKFSREKMEIMPNSADGGHDDNNPFGGEGGGA